MSASKVLPESHKKELVAVIDEALEEVRNTKDVALLQECRAVFRAKVPLNLRAYVAAVLALKSTNSITKEKTVVAKEKMSKKAKKSEPVKNDANKAEKNREPIAISKNEAVFNEKKERSNRYNEEGISLFISAGRRQRFFAKTLLKILTIDTGISEGKIGDIRTMDNYSFINIDPLAENEVVAALSGMNWKGRPLGINRARRKPEEAND